jgi:hypothetical protein
LRKERHETRNKKLLTRIVYLQVGSILATLLLCTIIALAGQHSAVGRAAIYIALAIGALTAVFGIALGYSVQWAENGRPKRVAEPRQIDDPSKL